MIRILTCLLCVLCLASGGCTDDSLMSSSPTSSPVETVPVELRLSTADYNTPLPGETRSGGEKILQSASSPYMDIELVGTPVTKAGGTTEENAIYNFAVLQFNGTTPEAVLTGKQIYNCPDGVIDTKSVELVLSGSGGGPYVKNRIVVLTNVTSGDLSSLTETQSTYSDLQNLKFVKGDDIFPLRSLSGKSSMVMCGMADAVIDSKDKQISITLQRTVAKVAFNIKIDPDGELGQKYKSWNLTLLNIPSVSYFNTLGRKAVFPSPDDWNGMGSLYWAKSLTNSHIMLPSDGQIAPDALYMPVNIQQAVPSSTFVTRRTYAPANGAYLQIMGMNFVDQGLVNIPTVSDYILYQIFLGKNLDTDFSIYSNYNLTYTITLKGEDTGDSNVVKFIPGKFGGALKQNGNKWEYEREIESYFKDAVYPSLTGEEQLTESHLRWYTGNQLNISSSKSLTDGFQNTKSLMVSDGEFIKYPAALSCYMGLNGFNSTTGYSFTNGNWYLPSVGELIGTWLSSSSLVNQQQASYWSSTAVESQGAYIVTKEGEVKIAAFNDNKDRHYVRGCRNPDYKAPVQ